MAPDTESTEIVYGASADNLYRSISSYKRQWRPTRYTHTHIYTSTMDPAEVAAIVGLVNGLMVDRYANTAGATVWFYDYLLTLSAEYKYIWRKKWSLVKVLYLLVRIRPFPTARARLYPQWTSIPFLTDLTAKGLRMRPQNRYLTPPFLILVLYRTSQPVELYGVCNGFLNTQIWTANREARYRFK